MMDLLPDTLAAALASLREHSTLVGLFNVDESTFRSFVLAELKRRVPDANCQTEWEKMRADLLFQSPERNVLIEFKFYITRPMHALDGSFLRWKGWAGPENEDDFRHCVEKVKAIRLKEIDDKFIVVVHELSTTRRSKYSFEESYRDLSRFGLDSTQTIKHSFDDTLVCKLTRIE